MDIEENNEEQFFLNEEQYQKALTAFKKNETTTLSQIIIQQAFDDRNVDNYNGDNSFEVALKLSDRFIDRFAKIQPDKYSDNDLKETMTLLYNVIINWIDEV